MLTTMVDESRNINLRVGINFGREVKYVVDEEQKRAIKELTGRESVTERDIQALIDLGFSVSETSVLGRVVDPIATNDRSNIRNLMEGRLNAKNV